MTSDHHRAVPSERVDTTVRDASVLDVPALTEHELALFGTDAWTETTWWAELAERPQRDYVVLEDPHGTIVGYAGLDHLGDTSDVMTVAVIPGQQGHGYGHLLLDELTRRAQRRSASSLMLEVRADNEPARALYARHGFTVISIRRRYYQPGDVDALVMRASLREDPHE